MTALVAAAALTLPACSFLLVKKPPASPPSDRVAPCTTTRIPLVVDIVVGAGLTALLGFIAVTNYVDGSTDTGKIAVGFGAGALASAGLFGTSAYYGARGIAACESYRVEAARQEDVVNPGAAGHSCRADGSCDPKLRCHAGVCVHPSAVPTPSGTDPR